MDALTQEYSQSTHDRIGPHEREPLYAERFRAAHTEQSDLETVSLRMSEQEETDNDMRTYRGYEGCLNIRPYIIRGSTS